MNASRLLEHFDRISEAPDAIPKLRKFILDLAVRGKLVEQDSRDEPAAILLVRIRTEKAKLAKDGTAKKSKPITPTPTDEIPFAIPATWAWSQLAEVGLISPRNTAPNDEPTSFVPMKLIPAEFGADATHEVRSWGEIKSGFTHFANGDVALAKITPCFENGKSTVFEELTGGIGAGTTELHVARPVLVCAQYLLVFLKSPYFIETGVPKMTGTAGQKRVSTEYFSQAPLPLPPLAEQRRIVAKVNELMRLCDRLEAAQANRQERQRQLTSASVDWLVTAHPKDGCRAAIEFQLEHFALLTSRSDQITALRETILALAVRGRLVSQDMNDEPAPELLKRVQSDTACKVTAGVARQRADEPVISSSMEPFDLPTGWAWTRLGSICFRITDGAHHTPKYLDAGVPFLSVKDVSSGEIDFSDTRFISEAAHTELSKRCRPERGDILLTKVGTTGIAVLVDSDQPFSIFVSLALLKFSQASILGPYLTHVINSPFVRKQSADNTQGIGNKNLVLRLINRFLIPLPPVAEQHRIVAKVDELLALCDRIEQQVTVGEVGIRRFVNATLEAVLAGAR